MSNERKSPPISVTYDPHGGGYRIDHASVNDQGEVSLGLVREMDDEAEYHKAVEITPSAWAALPTRTPSEIGEDLKSMGAPAELVDQAVVRAATRLEQIDAHRKALLGNAALNPMGLAVHREFIAERATGLVLATFSSHTAAAQALQLFRNPQWRAPFNKWYMMGSDHVQLHGLATLAQEALIAASN